ncbi:MAG: metalloregulator ArsR/SmtB family transcription factor [Pseudomonadales bacterium]
MRLLSSGLQASFIGAPAMSAAAQLDQYVRVTRAAGDRVRGQVLRLLRDGSYGVLELCQILDVAQPALSHHLKLLHGAGLLARRREGNAIFYRQASVSDPLRGALLAAADAIDLPASIERRIEAVHAARRQRSARFFEEHADEFAASQARICEPEVYLPVVLDLLRRHGLGSGRALEIGPGDGQLLSALAAMFDGVTGIDSAAGMLARSASAVATLDNVRLERCDFEALPARPTYQLVVAAMVLHHIAAPQQFFQHAQRLLQPGGMLLVAELGRHDNEWARQACGDLWLGFESDELGGWASDAGFSHCDAQYLAQKNGFDIQIHCYQNPKP